MHPHSIVHSHVPTTPTSVVDLWAGRSCDLGHAGAHVQLRQSQLVHKVGQLRDTRDTVTDDHPQTMYQTVFVSRSLHPELTWILLSFFWILRDMASDQSLSRRKSQKIRPTRAFAHAGDSGRSQVHWREEREKRITVIQGS